MFRNVRAVGESGGVKRLLIASFLCAPLAVPSIVSAQSNRLETVKGITASIAPYDANVRQAILEASQYPPILVQLQKSQDQTVRSFQRMIGKFRRQKQEWFYTLTRYPDLMHRLANLPDRQTESDIYKLLPNQDPALQEAAWKLYKNEKKNLVKLDAIQTSANHDLEMSIAHLDDPGREAFHKLQTLPDVLTLLTNNIGLTTQLGDHYRKNPSQVTNQLTALHDDLEVQNEQDVAAFKKQMESDPKAMEELRQAGNDYSSNPYYSYPYGILIPIGLDILTGTRIRCGIPDCTGTGRGFILDWGDYMVSRLTVFLFGFTTEVITAVILTCTGSLRLTIVPTQPSHARKELSIAALWEWLLPITGQGECS